VADIPVQFADALRDRYAIERELGCGGMATVYLALDVRHDRPVAIKVLRAELSSTLGTTPLGTARFLREIQLTARLQHASILPLFDSGEAAGHLWYVMPVVDGGTLRERLRREGQLPLDEALEITRRVLAALTCAHEHGIVHRDIKPENILLSRDGAVVSDFGIAHAISAVGAERLTETGLAVGTAAYMSPEQATADRRLDARSDLYSLGCVLYEMLAGEPPFTGPSAQAIIAKRLTEPVPHLRTVRDLPARIEAAVTRALARAPADRFATAEAFAAALQAAGTSPPTTKVVSPSRWRVDRRVWLVAALGALAVGGAVVAARRIRPPPAYAPGRVVVAPLENPTGDSVVGEFARRLLTTLPDAIAREGVGDPVPAATVRDVLGRAKGRPGEVADRLARETGAGLALRGVCNPSRAAGITCEVDVLRMPAKALRMSVSITGDPATPAFGAGLMERVLVALLLQQTYGDQVDWRGEYISPSLAAARRYVSHEEGGAREAARLDTAWAAASALAAAQDSNKETGDSILVRLARRPALLPGERDIVRWELAIRRGETRDLEQAFEIAKRRFALNPPFWRHALVWVAEVTGRSHTAVEAAREGDTTSAPPAARPNAHTYHMLGYALHHLGRYREELQVAREIERRWPTEVAYARTHQVMALAGLGQVDTLRSRLARWEATPESGDWAGTRAFIAGLELMAHGHQRTGLEMLSETAAFYRRLRESGEAHPEALASEVDALHMTGKLAEARRLGQAALTGSSTVADSVRYLGVLGSLAADEGRRSEAARYDGILRALGTRPRVLDAAFYRAQIAAYRAQIAAQLGDRQQAVRLLEQARAGGSLALHLDSHRNPAFASLRDYPPFQQFLAPRD
jgi:tetratricopeptide (TPR) repeat protein